MLRNAPPAVMAALEKNIFEHISLMAQEQLEVEFRDEIGTIDANATNGTTKPNVTARSAVPTTSYVSCQ